MIGDPPRVQRWTRAWGYMFRGGLRAFAFVILLPVRVIEWYDERKRR